MGRRRKKSFGDAVDGVLLLDKHAGVSSNQFKIFISSLL